jgi:hypothetical protein
LLAEPINVTGLVIDTQGRPVADASIDHSNDTRQAHKTDSDGRFELATRAPALVFRKAGFRSELVRSQNATEIRITLQRTSDLAKFPICSGAGRYEGLEGSSASFQFPRIEGIKARPQVFSIDADVRTYDAHTKPRKAITHGSGSVWSRGIPSDLDVWKSVKYEEAAFSAPGATAAGITIIDARGQFGNGNRWRYLGNLGESAVYSDVDERTATVFDRLLDGACLKAPTPK